MYYWLRVTIALYMTTGLRRADQNAVTFVARAYPITNDSNVRQLSDTYREDDKWKLHAWWWKCRHSFRNARSVAIGGWYKWE